MLEEQRQVSVKEYNYNKYYFNNNNGNNNNNNNNNNNEVLI